MTQEDKQLLLKDLCGRLPYRVNVKTTGDNESYTLLSINSNKNIALIGLYFGGVYATSKIKIDEVKPYLRPMSSMTKEEYKELKSISPYYGFAPYEYIDDWGPNYEMIDWLNSHHFDYRGLIPKGLAFKAPNGMYKEEQQ